jgi:hypothetical protein
MTNWKAREVEKVLCEKYRCRKPVTANIRKKYRPTAVQTAMGLAPTQRTAKQARCMRMNGTHRDQSTCLGVWRSASAPSGRWSASNQRIKERKKPFAGGWTGVVDIWRGVRRGGGVSQLL